MRVNIFCEIKNKHQVDSKKKCIHPHDIIPDEANKDICLNCKFPENKCKGSKFCVGFKKEKSNER